MTFQGIPAVLNDGTIIQLQPIVPLSPIYEEGYPCVPNLVMVTPVPTKEFGKAGAKWFWWRYTCDLSDGCLDSWIDGCNDRLLEPYSEPLIMVLEQLKFELEMCRLQRQKRRIWAKQPSVDWETADLLGAIQAASGEDGRMVGREWWFHCPLHEEDTASLHVDPAKRIWHCFGCNRGGGYVHWLRAVKGEPSGRRGVQ